MNSLSVKLLPINWHLTKNSHRRFERIVDHPRRSEEVGVVAGQQLAVHTMRESHTNLMHPDFCGNKRAGSTRGSQVKATLNFAAGPPHLGCYLLDVNVWN